MTGVTGICGAMSSAVGTSQRTSTTEARETEEKYVPI
jgi:hypothetical protein